MLLSVFVFASCYLLAYYLWQNSRVGPEPPSYPGAIPFIGHVHILSVHLDQLWTKTADIYYYSARQGGVISVLLGPKKVYIISDPDDSLTVLSSCLDKPYIYKFAKSWLGNGLVTSDVQTWKRHRKLLSPAFSQQALNGFIEIFNKQARRLVEQLSSHVGTGPSIPEEYLVANNFETVTQTTLNFKVHQQQLSEKYIEVSKSLFSLYVTRFKKIWMHVDYIYRWTANKKTEDELIRANSNIYNTVIQNRKLEMQHNCNSTSDIDATTDKFKSLLDIMVGFTEENKLTSKDVHVACLHYIKLY